MQQRKATRLRIEKSREVRTYAELWASADWLLQAGSANPIGSAHLFLSSLTLRAFSFEAYMNHVGPTVFACWLEELERLPPLSKFTVLCERLAVELPSKGRRPMSSVVKLFKFRNAIAHGKTEHALYVPTVRGIHAYEAELHARALSDWEKEIQSVNFALVAARDVGAVMQMLQDGRKECSDNLFSTGSGWSSATSI